MHSLEQEQCPLVVATSCPHCVYLFCRLPSGGISACSLVVLTNVPSCCHGIRCVCCRFRCFYPTTSALAHSRNSRCLRWSAFIPGEMCGAYRLLWSQTAVSQGQKTK